ncbi:MAG: D-aminoacylase [Acidobacteria bacterium]|nr:D-aminoacylase [Acidobacteriota bacterium]
MRKRAVILVALLVLPGCAGEQVESQKRLDLLITGGRVFDGSGRDWLRLDIGIAGERVAWIGKPGVQKTARRVIDARGLYVAPGFIDLHTHTAHTFLRRELSGNLNYLTQGVTTVVTGNDGSSPWPIAAALERYEEIPLGPNVALLVGHGTLRQQVLGLSDRRPSSSELQRMKRLLRRGITEGAFGLSTGLYYTPGSFATTDEIIALAREVKALGGYYDTHLRDESDYTVGLLKALEEALQIGKESGVPVNISHIKALGPTLWGSSKQVISAIENAKSRGIEVTADQPPYEASETGFVAALFPSWSQERGEKQLKHRLNDPVERRSIRLAVKENIHRRGGPERLMLSSAGIRALEGKTLLEISRVWKVTLEEAALRIAEAGGGSVFSFSMRPDDVMAFMRCAWVATSSDGTTYAWKQGRPHPRAYGSFPRKIGKFVLRERVISLPFAIRAATSLPATIARIPHRGWIRESFYADLVIFDLEHFRDRATYQDPHQYSEGVRYLLVNGVVAIENGKFSGHLAGRVLRKQPTLRDTRVETS